MPLSKSHRALLTHIPFAHRGLHRGGLIENSLSAFQAANRHGHGFELDILLSKDDKAMVFHDRDLKRLTGQAGHIDDFTARELSGFCLTGSDNHISTLSHILDETDQSLPILIEIKGDQGKYDQIARAVYDDVAPYNGPVAIMSFFPDIIKWFKENAPYVPRGLVATSINDGKMPQEYFSLDEQQKIMDDLSVDFIAYDIEALPNQATEYAQRLNMPVLTWTVRSEALHKKARQYTDNIIYENIDP